MPVSSEESKRTSDEDFAPHPSLNVATLEAETRSKEELLKEIEEEEKRLAEEQRKLEASGLLVV